ncbi:MAG: DUF389 domain-containing protein [Gemmatimonadota bacterium]
MTALEILRVCLRRRIYNGRQILLNTRAQMNPASFLKQRLALRGGTDMDGTVERVTEGASLSAENLWLLACSAVLASIGLDVSSAAVVIGAMLISPLMGPIIGVGLGMGVTNRPLLQSSLRELGLATGLSLAVSTAYFFISPFAAPTAELIARTTPTLLDVGVAFFGGVAGIVAGSRRKASLALPGVAIATALMPPLCTVGFGLATGNWRFAAGAFYLFGLNAIFIALSTFLVVRFLHFPHHEEVTLEDRRRERRLVATVAILAILPSIWFLYDVARGLREQNRIRSFVAREIESPGRAAAEWEHIHNRRDEMLKVYIAGNPIDSVAIASLHAALPRYGLAGLRLELVQSDVSARDLERFQGEVQRDMLRTISAVNAARDSSNSTRQRQDSGRYVSAARELASTFPEIDRISQIVRLDLLGADSASSAPAFMITFGVGVRPVERRSIMERSEAFLRARLAVPSLRVIER